MLRNRLSYLILGLTVLICAVFFTRHCKDSIMFYGDALGYYTYLPATFIYQNLTSIEQLPADSTIHPSVREHANTLKVEGLHTPKGYIVDQYTYAVALMESPFFFAAHAWEKITGGRANGYSYSYTVAMKISAMTYTLLGLLLTFSILRRYFDEYTSVLTVALVLLGSNLFWFTLHQPGMSHPILFCLYTFLMYLTIKVHERPKKGLFIVAGFIAGVIIIMRPTDIVCLFIPLLYNVYDKPSWQGKLVFIRKNHIGILLAAIAGFIAFVPQLLYWKMISGSYIYYSYGTQSFHWLRPKIINGLFYFANGWLPYAPVMIFAIAGAMFYKMYRQWALVILVVSPVYAYLIYSWFCYNYINGLGSRPMLHLYGLYSIPIAAVIQYVFQRKIVYRIVFIVVCLFFISVNYSFSWLKAEGMLNSEEANGMFATHMLFRNHLTYNDLVINDIEEPQPDTTSIIKIATLGFLNYDRPLNDHYVRADDGITFGKYYYRMNDDDYPPEAIRIVYSKQQFGDARWLKCSGMFQVNAWESYRRHLLKFSIYRGTKKILERCVDVDNKIGLLGDTCAHASRPRLDHFEHGRWGAVSYFVKIPRDVHVGDSIKLEIWNLFHKEILVDNMRLELYK